MFDPISLITGGIGLIGSLFGGGSETKTKEKSESVSDSESQSAINYQAMVDAATSAGFNPLTAIRTGGAAGFVTTRSKTKTTSEGESTSTSSTGPDIGGIAQAVGNIAGGLGLGMNNAADPIAAKSRVTRAGKTPAALVDSKLKGAQKRPAGSIYNPASGSGVKVSSNAASKANVSKATKGQVYGPPDPGKWAKDNKVADLYVPFYDRFTNKIVYGPNPDGPDGDQIPVPGMIAASNKLPASTRIVDSVANRYETLWERYTRDPGIKFAPATEEQKKRANDSWHGGWLPTFDFR